ncbi:hypothetical protein Q9S36_42750 [Microbacterium sp. ARD31]|uniref:hypothetical protein n=1 Tax=Microbacterium sp. ARD31 TaxID=2962576 RepID=UPI002882D251|nr:hypothetical protein [Microbacterium sp. ARD31]MDT0186925.1 hypothetical protein [Microbacterium sp. ARD31]
MSSLLAAAVLTTAGLLPVPLPSPLSPGEPTPPAHSSPEQPVLTGVLDAPDGRLKRGCKDYHYAYAVTTPSSDWTFDITMQDRAGKGVNAQSLIGPNDPTSGVLEFRLCRWATKPGMFALKGQLVSYDGSQEASVTVTEAFRMRKRNP